MANIPQTLPRRETRLSPTSIQEMLDENVRLIHSLMAHQRCGAVKEASELQQILHRNLIYLATIADRTAVHANPNGQQMPQQTVPPGPVPVPVPSSTAPSHAPPMGVPGVSASQSASPQQVSVSTYPHVPERCAANSYPPQMTPSSGPCTISQDNGSGYPPSMAGMTQPVMMNLPPQHFQQGQSEQLPNGTDTLKKESEGNL
ncbi:SSXT protein [Opisthorchis viverrini]|uniref:SSXT protein n=1 Tax=Opisthorchis viverrini TaxID=6198 RepID=A0A1S8WHG1_OPIVI|nr:SSXT protein [Opisthorchis viverrini]